jgi:hypothetical protein
MFGSQFSPLAPTATIQSRNTNNEDAPSNPKWVLLVTPQKGAPIALEKKIKPWEECATAWNFTRPSLTMDDESEN